MTADTQHDERGARVTESPYRIIVADVLDGRGLRRGGAGFHRGRDRRRLLRDCARTHRRGGAADEFVFLVRGELMIALSLEYATAIIPNMPEDF